MVLAQVQSVVHRQPNMSNMHTVNTQDSTLDSTYRQPVLTIDINNQMSLDVTSVTKLISLL